MQICGGWGTIFGPVLLQEGQEQALQLWPVLGLSLDDVAVSPEHGRRGERSIGHLLAMPRRRPSADHPDDLQVDSLHGSQWGAYEESNVD